MTRLVDDPTVDALNGRKLGHASRSGLSGLDLIAAVGRLRQPRQMALSRSPSEMCLRLGDGPQVRIENEEQLLSALERLGDLAEGKSAVLSQGRKHYVEAVKRGFLWFAFARRGSFWTKVQFYPGDTVLSERHARASRAADHRRFWRLLLSPPDLTGLERSQVESLFAAFWNGADWPVPILSDQA